jgi:hypothetical protein
MLVFSGHLSPRFPHKVETPWKMRDAGAVGLVTQENAIIIDCFWNQSINYSIDGQIRLRRPITYSQSVSKNERRLEVFGRPA